MSYLQYTQMTTTTVLLYVLTVCLFSSTFAQWLPNTDGDFAIFDNPDDDVIFQELQSTKRSEMPPLSAEQIIMIMKQLKNHKSSDRDDAVSDEIAEYETPSVERSSPLSFGTDIDAISTMLASRRMGKHGRMRSVRHRLAALGKR
ncbi:hypothetical protein CAPTEDRAFT_185225 [Capitella teleta]|uniref:Corticotropin-releasing factor domain-containing protein n=1 Tax=Capitella teleta TaxID=283909 RepID=R7TJE0_CAPTE|nr:hypothetical protein CAPTEDRAFT_185225 [Capitella teleta]|eukprot:ELT93933.1 hypothetical protein CAPTEDRAFT_185225 [Capitella teleta]